MEDEILSKLEGKSFEVLLKVSKNTHISNCVCSNLNTTGGNGKKGKKAPVLLGWSQERKNFNSENPRSHTKKSPAVSRLAPTGKNKGIKFGCSKFTNNEQKVYFKHHENRTQHIENYRMEFSTVKLASNTDVKLVDPYMTDKGDQGHLLMRIKLLETLSEFYKYDLPYRDLRGKSNGLPPIRVSNPQQGGNSTTFKTKWKGDQGTAKNSRHESSIRGHFDDYPRNLKQQSIGRNSRSEEIEDRNRPFVDQNGSQSFDALSLTGNDDEARKVSNQKYQCSNVQDLSKMTVCDKQALSNTNAAQGASATAQPCRKDKIIEDLLRPVNDMNKKNSVRVKQDLTFSRARTDEIISSKSPFLSQDNRRRQLSHDKLDNSPVLTEKAINSISSKKNANPLYISILGKSPICREFYEGNS